jgi:hypothetical protein
VERGGTARRLAVARGWGRAHYSWAGLGHKAEVDRILKNKRKGKKETRLGCKIY